ncbi:FAD binding domain-containing protein [Paenibacillus chartarius]|uniref:FAD binding domain-containing protein n=1 Tax=Paenibacillus chartarius TaxID=747481 RepID=A0ABV6DH23_9BACL
MAERIGKELAHPAVWHPKDAAEARRLRMSLGSRSLYVAGGTLLRTQWEAELRKMPEHVIDLGSVRELREIAEDGCVLKLGSQTTLAECRSSMLLMQDFPLLAEAARAIAAPSVRNLASLGGNVVSCVGDTIPALLIYEAELLWLGNDGWQIEPIGMWLDQMQQQGDADMDRLLVSVRLPIDAGMGHAGRRFGCYHKVGRREAFTPSVVTVAIRGSVSGEGKLCGLRAAAGGGQTIPRRLVELEEQLEGAAPGEAALAAAYETVMKSFDPKGDAFASAEYRRVTAANLITAALWQAAQSGHAGTEVTPCC